MKHQLNTPVGFITIDRMDAKTTTIRMMDMKENRAVSLKLDNTKLAYLHAIITETVKEEMACH